MCTALSFKCGAHFFGRTLDMEFSYGENIIVTPRKFPLQFVESDNISEHFAFIGVAHEAEGYPLYFDAVNERGLCAAALNFPFYSRYHGTEKGALNIAPFEVIPRVLSTCKNLEEARALLSGANIVDKHFSAKLENTPLHWIIADSTGSITVESVEDGLKIYDNPVGVLTNSPPFPVQLFNLNNYIALTREPPVNRFSEKLPLTVYSRGMGAMGLPGDLSSQSRFVRAAFIRQNSVCGADAREGLAQFFHILGGVAQQRGCVHLGENKYELTVYTSCCDTARGVYYYTTYSGTCLSAVDMHRENLDGKSLAVYPMTVTNNIVWNN